LASPPDKAGQQWILEHLSVKSVDAGQGQMRQNDSMSKQAEGPDEQNDPRMSQAATWAAEVLGLEQVNLEPVSGDASFRRYFRFGTGNRSLILMDAPPEIEDSSPFVDIDRRLRKAGLNAPEILHFDLELGFGLLEDFGDMLYRDILDEKSADGLFPPLFTVLEGMARGVDTGKLPRYNLPLLQQEMDLFPDWYLRIHRKRPFSSSERHLWDALCTQLIRSACEQPQVFVHKDFHSCNILRTDSGEPGIIDFQDGVSGPLSYDFISLLWDRYIAWPRERLESWMKDFHQKLGPDCDLETWIRWCDLMGLQRNLKIVGIFARLHYRDGKLGYLDMIPRFYGYLLDVLPRYDEFHEFQLLLEQSECAP
jgi:aminoglycoside/choline kinase family phosphotransferase